MAAVTKKCFVKFFKDYIFFDFYSSCKDDFILCQKMALLGRCYENLWSAKKIWKIHPFWRNWTQWGSSVINYTFACWYLFLEYILMPKYSTNIWFYNMTWISNLHRKNHSNLFCHFTKFIKWYFWYTKSYILGI